MANTRRKLIQNQLKIKNLKESVGEVKLLGYDSEGKIVDAGDVISNKEFINGINESNNVVALGGEIIQPTELYIRETNDYDLGLQQTTKVLEQDEFFYLSTKINDQWTIIKLDSNYNIVFQYGIFNNIVRDIDINPDGTIIAVGMFTQYNGVSHNRAVKLLPDGSVDSTFVKGTGFNAGAGPFNNVQNTRVKILPDTSIIFTGQFTTYNGVNRAGIIRLNQDGSLFENFNDGDGILGGTRTVWGVDIQSDGKIVIVGNFGLYNGVGTPTMYIARINQDGTLDSTFTPTTPLYNDLLFVRVKPDNKIIASGFRSQLLQLNADGSPDTSFNDGNNFTGTKTENMSGTEFSSIELLPNGDVLVSGAGKFTEDPSGVYKYLIKVDSFGNIIESFDSKFNQYVSSTFTNDQTILAFGNFTEYDSIAVKDFAEITLDDAELVIFKKGIDIVHEKGLVKYKDNYHDDYDDRTLVDKEYVDNKIQDLPDLEAGEGIDITPIENGYLISSNQAHFISSFTYDGSTDIFELPFIPIDIEYVLINGVQLPLNLILWYPELNEEEGGKNIRIPSPNGEFLLEDQDKITVRFLYKEI